VAFCHLLTQRIVADDHRATLGHQLIGAEVVGVRVGIDDEFDRLRAHTRDGRLDLGAHLRDGGVHEQNAVVTDEEKRIAALPVQQVDAMTEVRRRDLELRVVDLLCED